MLAEMLTAWIGRRPDMQVVGCAANGADALALCRKQRPDVATVDIQLPGMDGLALTEQLFREVPAPKVIILTGRQHPYLVVRAKQLGVHGYVDKMSPLAELGKAIRTVAAGGQFFAGNVLQALKQQQGQPDAFSKLLTMRECSILGLIATGLSDAEVGEHLQLSPDTVGAHRRKASRKLEIFNDRKLMHRARELGLDYSIDRRPAAEEARPLQRKK